MSPSEVPSGSTLFAESTTRFRILTLITEVQDDGVYVRLSPFQRGFQKLPADEIEAVSDAPYRASKFGGWHWGARRTLGGNRVYRLQGSGVEIERTDGTTWYIGSADPQGLRDAIEQMQSD